MSEFSEELNLKTYSTYKDLQTILECGSTIKMFEWTLQYVHHFLPPDEVKGYILTDGEGHIVKEFSHDIQGALEYMVDLLARLDDKYLPF